MSTLRNLSVAIGVCLAAVFGGAGGASASSSTVDVPVSFSVTNVNGTAVGCSTDAKPYTVRGHLTGPASLGSASTTAGTLYLHGLELGEWFWRVPVDGYDYSREMAARGHVSVTIDRLGYGDSDHPAGSKVCVGSQANIAHQIVQQLRAGTYHATLHPRFARVALAGHSLGGSIAQVEAYSFADVDAVAVLSYADVALTPATLATPTSWGPKCLSGGYAYFTRDQAAYRANFLAGAPEPVRAYADTRRSLNPCGDLMSAVAAAMTSLVSVNKIKVPVFLLMGDKDLVFDSSRLALQKPLYGGPVTTRVLAGATHGVTLDVTAGQFRDAMDGWLSSVGF